jgi:hypothetical protein
MEPQQVERTQSTLATIALVKGYRASRSTVIVSCIIIQPNREILDISELLPARMGVVYDKPL